MAFPKQAKSAWSETFPDAQPRKRDLSTEEEGDSEFESIFVGPRDLTRHSKWPMFLRLHGSVMPSMVLPILFIGSWATAITCIHLLVYDIGINHVLLTVMGFVVGMSLSFRSSTAYERYNEGRKYWAQLSLGIQNLARIVWVQVEERPGSEQDDLLTKISFCNLLVAYAYALKHRLRFEPFTHYDDLHHRVKHLPILAQKAEVREWPEPSAWKIMGLMLGLPMAESNPRKLTKNAPKPLGNVPLEILTYISAHIKKFVGDGTLGGPPIQTVTMTAIAQLNDVLTGTDRILNTPLPIAYCIAIAQITWVYILLLPFQLVETLKWVTIPATIFAAYIILGFALIGREIENPFGEDVNDLPLDLFCEQIREDVDIILAQAPAETHNFVRQNENAFLYPLSHHGYQSLKSKSPKEIRMLLARKPNLATARGDQERILADRQEPC